MFEQLYCKCGEPIVVEHNAHGRTCMANGMRFYHPQNRNNRSCLFRCSSCSIPVEYDNLVSLGELNGDQEINPPAQSVESAGTSNNKPSTPCEVAASCPVKRCQQCKRYYDDLYQLT
jgi:hypothetical protein